MKKTYISPVMNVVELKNRSMLLAGSLAKGGDYAGEGVGAPEFFIDDDDE